MASIEHHTRDCGCIQVWTDLQNPYGPTRMDGDRCVLHGGEIPYKGTHESFLLLKGALLKDENSKLTDQLRRKQQREKAQPTQEDMFRRLEENNAQLELENFKLRALLKE